MASNVWGDIDPNDDDNYQPLGHASGILHLAAVNELLRSLRCRNIALSLDSPTEGLGNCFVYGLMQQLHRPEIRSTLSESLKIISRNHDFLRKAIVQFVRETLYNQESEYYAFFDASRTNYVLSGTKEESANPPDWEEHLEYMSFKGSWFDAQFVNFASCFINRHIVCYTSSGEMEFCGS